MALTEKQEQFCQRYLIDFNATQAALAAGYSEDSAGVIGWENLRKPEIQSRISEIRKEMGIGFNITRERIAQEYARLAFFDIRKIHDVDGGLKNVRDFGDDEAAAIAGIEVIEERAKDDAGDDFTTGQLKKVKIADKRAALDSLVKLMGYNSPDKVEHSGPGGVPLVTNINVSTVSGTKSEGE